MRNRILVGGLVLTAGFGITFGALALSADPVHSPDAAPTSLTSTAPTSPLALPTIPAPSIATSTDAPYLTGNQPTPPFDLSQHPVDEAASLWVVVNKARSLDPRTFEPKNLVRVRGVQAQDVVADDLVELLDGARSDGVRIKMRTAYRSYGQQQFIFNQKVAQRGRERAEQGSARAGHTEHQTGLAVDFGSTSRPSCDLKACFADTPEGAWLADNAWEYGFIQRYTAENTEITGFMAEGWHFRYIGRELAAHMRAADIDSLEELFGVPGGWTYPN